MAKMSIYIPDDLKERMDTKPSENWSSIAQRAFELQLKTLVKGGDDMSAVVERLRASKASREEVERPSWVAKGRAWASNEAKYEQLASVGGMPNDYDDDNDPQGYNRLRQLTIYCHVDADIGHGEMREMVERITGDERFRLSGRQISWFVEGAQAVWEEVKDEI